MPSLRPGCTHHFRETGTQIKAGSVTSRTEIVRSVYTCIHCGGSARGKAMVRAVQRTQTVPRTSEEIAEIAASLYGKGA